VDPHAVEVVRKGMSDVVNSGYGTGRGAALSYTTLCGKTGTAQWGPPTKNQRLAWFAGFLPEDNPRYSFAVLYEGRPNERVSGGRMAAPMVKKFFEGIKDDIKDIIAPPQKALVVVNEATGDVAAPVAEVVPEGEAAPIPSPAGDAPLKALPVETLDIGLDAAPLDAYGETSAPEPQRPMRALPVGDDEVIEENVEEP
jgi:penicillin-binding protein 2